MDNDDLADAIRDLAAAIRDSHAPPPQPARARRRSAFRTVRELSEEWGAGFTPRYIRSQLQPGGVFHGLGHKKGQEWRFSDADIDEMAERIRADPEGRVSGPPPEGLSKRSKWSKRTP